MQFLEVTVALSAWLSIQQHHSTYKVPVMEARYILYNGALEQCSYEGQARRGPAARSGYVGQWVEVQVVENLKYKEL